MTKRPIVPIPQKTVKVPKIVPVPQKTVRVSQKLIEEVNRNSELYGPVLLARRALRLARTAADRRAAMATWVEAEKKWREDIAAEVARRRKAD